MKKLLWVLIAVFIIGAIGFGGFKVYGMGYASGKQAGYESGYDIGRDDGYQSGQKDGYEQGYKKGNTDGFTSGFTNGKNEGYTEGYDVGNKDGYQSGYDSGKQAGYQDGYGKGETAGYTKGMNDGLGHGYTIKDATYAQVLDFLARDETDEKTYNLPVYVCSHFTRDVCNNAETAGIRCAVVELRYASGNGHLIVAFNTIDRGLVYFEPQTDERAEPAIGKRYYQTVIPKPGYFYKEPDHDDTIQDMVVIW
jgi:hypothetical protein